MKSAAQLIYPIFGRLETPLDWEYAFPARDAQWRPTAPGILSGIPGNCDCRKKLIRVSPFLLLWFLM
jgi:hypothetical protein